MLGTFTVTLAGKSHTVKVKPMLPMEEFREKCIAPIVGEMIEQCGPEIQGILALIEVDSDDVTIPEQLVVGASKILPSAAKVLGKIAPFLMGEGLTRFTNGVWLYEPDLEKYRDQSTDEEIIDAAFEVLRITLPFYKTVWKSAMRFMEVMRPTEDDQPTTK